MESKKKRDEVERQERRYIRMVKGIFKVCQRQAVPQYSSKFSRKDFTLRQHIALPRTDAEDQEVIS